MEKIMNEEKIVYNDNPVIANPVPDGAITTKSKGVTIHCLTIIGQIEGHYLLANTSKATKYEHIIPLLVSVEENDEVDGLLIILNTMGGDVEAGLALSEMIASMSKPTVSLVLGGGHSIGIPLAVSAKKSYIVPSATMTLHPVRMNGVVIGAPQTYDYLNRMQDRILKFTADHSNTDETLLREYMMKTDEMATDIGSILDGEEAVKIGLIDEIGGLSESLNALHEMINDIKDIKKDTD